MLWEVYQATIRRFLWNTIAMESTDFFVTQMLDDKANVNTSTFDPVLFEFWVTTATMIKFTQINDV